MKIPTNREWYVLYHHREMKDKLDMLNNLSLQEIYAMKHHDEEDYELFGKQIEILSQYVKVLEERIARFGEKK